MTDPTMQISTLQIRSRSADDKSIPSPVSKLLREVIYFGEQAEPPWLSMLRPVGCINERVIATKSRRVF